VVGEVKERMDNVKRAKYLSDSVLCRTILVIEDVEFYLATIFTTWRESTSLSRVARFEALT
jgi:hypothetical protein